jgi:AmmeMemoRadiSam system protein B
MSAQRAIDSPVHIRPPAVAGTFYPADAQALGRDVRAYMEGVDPSLRQAAKQHNQQIKAIIAPHAGYRYSAPIAASTYTFVEPLRSHINRVVLIGPSHRVLFSGLACSSAAAFDTPLGAVPVDVDTTQKLTQIAGVHIHDVAHAPEHGLEVHLPLLIHTLARTDEPGCAGFSIVPLVFGDVDDDVVTEVLDPFLDDENTLIVISSDLSHFNNYDTASELDRETADAIVNHQVDFITPDRACGHTCLRAMLRCASARGLRVTEVDLRNSGDTSGTRDSVVGYGAFTIS